MKTIRDTLAAGVRRNLVLLIVLAPTFGLPVSGAESGKPNLILIFADDK